MPCFVGLDASKKTTHICVMERDGAVVREGVVETTPQAIIGFLRGEGRRSVRVGLETWGMAQWLYEGLAKARLPVICIGAREAHGILKAQRNKTDRNDARGIAEIMRIGAYRKIHIKSASSQETRALLTARAMLVIKAGDVANTIRGLLLGLGLKLPRFQRRTFDLRVRALISKHAFAGQVIEPLLAARAAILKEKDVIEALLLATAQRDPVCRRLMTAPGVGALTALTYRTAIDEPARFARSRTVGAHLGLTSRTWQSGDISRQGRISKCGDAAARRALFLAAQSLCRTIAKPSWLKAWGRQLVERRGYKRAMIAVARRLAVILHQMWMSETDFRWEGPALG
jgi:transposase